MPQLGGREGEALQYGGRTTYLSTLGDPVGEHPIFLKFSFSIRHASYFDKALQCVKKVAQ